MSFNNGVYWENIDNGKLHLQNKSSDFFSSIHSEDAITGIILANGNRGKYLNDKTQTFISTDHGVNWNLVSENSSVIQNS